MDVNSIEAALDVLCHAPKEVLQHYMSKVLLAFERLRTTVENHAVIDHGSTVLASNSIQIPTTVAVFVRSLDCCSDQIGNYLSRSEVEAVGHSTMDRDMRIIKDLELDGRQLSPTTMFRKALSQRSLAIEYNDWELREFKQSRISELVGDLSTSRKRVTGHVPQFLIANNCRFNEPKKVKYAIEYGIKTLVFEDLFGAHAISGVICFRGRLFQKVKFEDLPLLSDLLKKSKWITALVESKKSWFDRCEQRYESSQLDPQFLRESGDPTIVEFDMNQNPTAPLPRSENLFDNTDFPGTARENATPHPYCDKTWAPLSWDKNGFIDVIMADSTGANMPQHNDSDQPLSWDVNLPEDVTLLHWDICAQQSA